MVHAWKHWFDSHVYLAVFFASVLEGLGLPVPAEVLFLATAGLIHAGRATLGQVIGAAVTGNMTGSLCGFSLAYYGGPALLKRVSRVVGLKQGALDQVETFFRRYGATTVFMSRFIGFIRAATVYVAGAARMSPIRFGLYMLMAVTIWNAGWAYLAFRFGAGLPHVLQKVIGHSAVWAVTLVGIVVLGGIWLKRRRTVS